MTPTKGSGGERTGNPPQTKATLPVQVHNSKDRNLQVGGAFGSVPNPSEATLDNKMD